MVFNKICKIYRKIFQLSKKLQSKLKSEKNPSKLLTSHISIISMRMRKFLITIIHIKVILSIMTNQFHHREMFSPLSSYNLEKRYERALLFIYTQHTIIHYGNNNNSTTASHSDCFSSPLSLFICSHTRKYVFHSSSDQFLLISIQQSLAIWFLRATRFYCVTYARTLNKKNLHIWASELKWIKKYFRALTREGLCKGWSIFNFNF